MYLVKESMNTEDIIDSILKHPEYELFCEDTTMKWRKVNKIVINRNTGLPVLFADNGEYSTQRLFIEYPGENNTILYRGADKQWKQIKINEHPVIKNKIKELCTTLQLSSHF